MPPADQHFVQIADALREINPWTHNEWLCRPDVVAAEKLLLVRANMAPMHCHPFHYHPHREEIIYVLYGRAEQWVGDKFRILSAGEMAHIPAGTVHATYNPHNEPLVFLAILSPANLPDDLAAAPDPFDVSSLNVWWSRMRRQPTGCSPPWSSSSCSPPHGGCTARRSTFGCSSAIGCRRLWSAGACSSFCKAACCRQKSDGHESFPRCATSEP